MVKCALVLAAESAVAGLLGKRCVGHHRRHIRYSRNIHSHANDRWLYVEDQGHSRLCKAKCGRYVGHNTLELCSAVSLFRSPLKFPSPLTVRAHSEEAASCLCHTGDFGVDRRWPRVEDAAWKRSRTGRPCGSLWAFKWANALVSFREKGVLRLSLSVTKSDSNGPRALRRHFF